MKKLFAVLLFVLCMVCSVAAGAENIEDYWYAILSDGTAQHSGDYWYAILSDGTAQITIYTGEDADLTIPAELDGYPVSSIGDHAFYGCSYLTSVTIPDSVTTLGANPFSICNKLETISVSTEHPSLAVIDGVLFSKADNRLVWYSMTREDTSYEIPNGTRIIDDYAFYSSTSLKNISVPDTVTTIGDYAFSGCWYLTSVTIPDGVTSIGVSAFSSTGLRSINIPDTVTTIGDYVFYCCVDLTSVIIPDSVTSIGDYAFSGCWYLTSVTIPDSVTSIGEEAFYECPSLTVTVGRSSYAEQYCKANGIAYTSPDALD